jgi:hypothetical protein
LTTDDGRQTTGGEATDGDGTSAMHAAPDRLPTKRESHDCIQERIG